MMEADNCARGEESKRREALNELQFCFCLGSEGRWAVRFGWLKNAAWKELQEHVEQRVVAVLRQCIAAAEQRSCVRSVTKKKHRVVCGGTDPSCRWRCVRCPGGTQAVERARMMPTRRERLGGRRRGKADKEEWWGGADGGTRRRRHTRQTEGPGGWTEAGLIVEAEGEASRRRAGWPSDKKWRSPAGERLWGSEGVGGRLVVCVCTGWWAQEQGRWRPMLTSGRRRAGSCQKKNQSGARLAVR